MRSAQTAQHAARAEGKDARRSTSRRRRGAADSTPKPSFLSESSMRTAQDVRPTVASRLPAAHGSARASGSWSTAVSVNPSISCTAVYSRCHRNRRAAASAVTGASVLRRPRHVCARRIASGKSAARAWRAASINSSSSRHCRLSGIDNSSDSSGAGWRAIRALM